MRAGNAFCLFMEPFSSYRVSLPCLDMKICSWYCKLVGCVQWISLGSLLISEKKKMEEWWIWNKGGLGMMERVEWRETAVRIIIWKRVHKNKKINQRLSSWSRLMFEEEGKRVYSIMHLEWNPNVKNVRFFCLFLVFVSQ